MEITILDKGKVSIIGGGYVGIPISISLAKKAKRKVQVFDTNAKKINEYNIGIDRTETPLFNKYFSKINFTSSQDDLKGTKIFIVTVPTPINDKYEPDLSFCISAIEIISSYLTPQSIVIFESTVYPMATREIFIPLLEKKSKLKCNKDFWVGYSPERINPGDQKNTFEKITKLVSGSDVESGFYIKKFYEEIISDVYLTPSIEVAESSKVIENIQRDINIALMNELSIIFRRLCIPFDEILKAANTKWNFHNYKPGLVGGHCIGIDPYYLVWKSTQIGYYPTFLTEARKINESMASYHAKEILSSIKQNNKKILILGITFKEDCADIRNSKVFDLIQNLLLSNKDIDVVDPHIDSNEIDMPGITFIDINNIDLKKYSITVLATPHKEFKNVINNINKNNLYIVKEII